MVGELVCGEMDKKELGGVVAVVVYCLYDADPGGERLKMESGVCLLGVEGLVGIWDLVRSGVGSSGEEGAFGGNE